MIQNINPLHDDRTLTGKTQKDISVVISLLNEKESLPELVSWIRTVMKDNGFSYEIIMVDDGSTDGSWELIKGLASERIGKANTGNETATATDNAQETATDNAQETGANDIRGISFRRNYGKSSGRPCGHHHGRRPAGFT